MKERKNEKNELKVHTQIYSLWKKKTIVQSKGKKSAAVKIVTCRLV